jgi:hypothetical protein
MSTDWCGDLVSTAERIETYLKTHAQAGSVAVVNARLRGNDILLFGETHVKLGVKERFFAETIRSAKRSGLFRYHASEHLINDSDRDGREIEEFLEGKRERSALSAHLRQLTAIFEAVRESLPGFGLVFAGSRSSGTARDGRIHAQFTSSRSLHLKAGRFDRKAAGQFHLGADHAGRVPNEGSSPTTCGRLVADGFRVDVIRVTVDAEGSAAQEGFGLVFEAGESVSVEEPQSGEAIDLLPLLRKVSDGKPLFADLRKSQSPFREVVDAGGRARFADRFDAILHLPG